MTPFSDLKAIGAGLVILGAALGIGRLAKAAVESMARQPEIAGNIQTAMIIAAALIEGVTFFALIIILLQVLFGLDGEEPAPGSDGSRRPTASDRALGSGSTRGPSRNR